VRQEVLVKNSTRFHRWPLVEACLENARRLCQRDPAEAEHLARLAILVTDLLAPGRYGAERVEDLRAKAWGELGSVLRIQERFRESEQAFLQASVSLRAGTGDPLEKAAILCLEASLWRDRRLFDRAIRLLDRTISIARKAGDRHRQGIALIQKAHCDTERGQPEAALPLLLQAQALLQSSADPRLLLVVQHNILFALVNAGRFEEAAAGLDDTRALCRQLDYPIDRIRIDYLEGMVFHGLGRLDDAEERFRSALQAMLAEGLDYDAALVGLDLAALLSQQNRHTEVRELAAAMLPVFTSHRIHREAIAALLVFQEAVKREELSAQLVGELSAYLRNAASDPQLRFQPPAWLRSTKS
jgi:tetratricopeptide (TPR) repeat protein